MSKNYLSNSIQRFENDRRYLSALLNITTDDNLLRFYQDYIQTAIYEQKDPPMTKPCLIVYIKNAGQRNVLLLFSRHYGFIVKKNVWCKIDL